MIGILLDPRPLPTDVPPHPVVMELHTDLVSWCSPGQAVWLDNHGFLSQIVLGNVMDLGWLFTVRKAKKIVGILIAYPTDSYGVENTVDPRLHLFNPRGKLLYAAVMATAPVEVTTEGEIVWHLVHAAHSKWPTATKVYGWRGYRLMKPVSIDRIPYPGTGAWSKAA
jgi:hypothetical protein